MLINSWTRFLLVLKKTGGFLEIKERGEKKKEKKRERKKKESFSDETRFSVEVLLRFTIELLRRSVNQLRFFSIIRRGDIKASFPRW